jgi:hypothetical protein
MSETQALIGYGTIIEVGNAPGLNPTFTKLDELLSVTPPDETVGEVEATNMDSADAAREFLPTLTDNGSPQANFNHIPGDATEQFIRQWRASRQKRRVRITYPDGTMVLFTAHVASFAPGEAGTETKLVATLTMRVSGPVLVVPAAAPVNEILPSIAGIAQVGQVLRAVPGQWSGGPTFTYQWQEDAAGNGTFANIAGATGQNFTPQAGQQTDRIRVTVTGTNAVGSASATSAPTIPTVAA